MNSFSPRGLATGSHRSSRNSRTTEQSNLRFKVPLSAEMGKSACLRPSGLVRPQPMRTGAHDRAPGFVFGFPVIALPTVIGGCPHSRSPEQRVIDVAPYRFDRGERKCRIQGVIHRRKQNRFLPPSRIANAARRDIARVHRRARKIVSPETDPRALALTGAGCREFDTIAVWTAL
jgi:hypothetical protein